MSRFIRNQDETFTPAAPWIYSTLELLPDGRYRLTLKNQEKRFFSGTTGRLLQRVDPSGNTQSFAWGGPWLEQIEDASGRIVTVSNSPGPENTTTTVTDWMGRTLTYERKHPSHMGFLTRYIDPEGVATDYTIDTHDTPDSPRFMGVESITCANGLWLTNYPVSDLSPQTTVVGHQVFGNGLAACVNTASVASPGLFRPRCVAKSLICLKQTATFCSWRGQKNPSTMLGPDTHTGCYW